MAAVRCAAVAEGRDILLKRTARAYIWERRRRTKPATKDKGGWQRESDGEVDARQLTRSFDASASRRLPLPVVWARAEDGAPKMSLSPGPSLKRVSECC